MSDKPQTTRTQVRGVLNRPDVQVVFVDTPGIHKPRTLLGERLNDTASQTIGGVDVVCLVVDAAASIGPGDRFVAARVPTRRRRGGQQGRRRARPMPCWRSWPRRPTSSALEHYFPVSARPVPASTRWSRTWSSGMPEGPQLYPDDMVTDVPEAFWVAELVREQLLAVTHDELPHSIATRVTEWEWPRIRVEILVERDSQKGIVIGHKGSVLKAVGTAVREQLPPARSSSCSSRSTRTGSAGPRPSSASATDRGSDCVPLRSGAEQLEGVGGCRRQPSGLSLGQREELAGQGGGDLAAHAAALDDHGHGQVAAEADEPGVGCGGLA